MVVFVVVFVHTHVSVRPCTKSCDDLVEPVITKTQAIAGIKCQGHAASFELWVSYAWPQARHGTAYVCQRRGAWTAAEIREEEWVISKWQPGLLNEKTWRLSHMRILMLYLLVYQKTVCLPVRRSFCLSVCPSICLSFGWFAFFNKLRITIEIHSHWKSCKPVSIVLYIEFTHAHESSCAWLGWL